MEDLFKNKMFLAVIVFGVVGFTILVGSNMVIDKVVDKVIERLEKNYSPSPYGPGFDPDKVNVDSLNHKVFFPENTDVSPSEARMDLIQSSKWEDDWEKLRGFNPEQ